MTARIHRSRMIVASIALAAMLTGCSEGDPQDKVSGGITAECAQHDTSLQAALKAGVETHGIPGISVAVDMPDCSLRSTAGYADLDQQTPVATDDLFRIGSITKTFTASVAMILVGEGKIGLDVPISTYLPTFTNGYKITVRQLLNHTSGLFNSVEDDGFWATLDADPAKLWTSDEIVAEAMKKPVYFEPGMDWHYSNTGCMVVGMIIEKVTGSTLSEQMQQRIFDPLGLKHTYLDPGDGKAPPVDGLVHGYSKAMDGSMSDVTSLYSTSVAWAAGAVVTSSSDLNSFYEALFQGRLVPEPQLAEMRAYTLYDTPVFQQYLGTCTGYGLALTRCTRDPLGELEGHGGAIWGFRARSFYGIEHDAFITVVINGEDSPAIDDIAGGVLEAILPK